MIGGVLQKKQTKLDQKPKSARHLGENTVSPQDCPQTKLLDYGTCTDSSAVPNLQDGPFSDNTREILLGE